MPSKILFVDDEKNILKSFARLLADTELEVITAASGEEALPFFKDHIISVIVSDNMMPGMKGVDLLTRVKEISPDTVRILLTGYADLTTAVDAINMGEVYRFLIKPWDNEKLLATLREAKQRFDLVQSLKKSDEDTLLSLAQTIELKDAYTRGHCDNVARYALAIADTLELPATVKEHIKHGSWLHDCGKIGVPESILNKKGPLTEEEFTIIKKHPQWGADVARQARLPEAEINIILYHHEKYGGNGYPTGIAGEEIPLEARIVAVADIFDALTTKRSYRDEMSFQKASEILIAMKNRHLDPFLVDTFLQNISADDIKKHSG
ncbi:MAG: response regulator [Proteobacteria bacterium]|nr:response regulator [Pseudomonadota bacterium]MBU1715363.1 response regulator [Pseudomonadota bacterium]